MAQYFVRTPTDNLEPNLKKPIIENFVDEITQHKHREMVFSWRHAELMPTNDR